jgi:hypothetical protein
MTGEDLSTYPVLNLARSLQRGELSCFGGRIDGIGPGLRSTITDIMLSPEPIRRITLQARKEDDGDADDVGRSGENIPNT